MSNELKDVNGLLFKVGCVFKDPDWCEMEVLKIIGDDLICMGYSVGQYHRSAFKAPRILHYRELAPDKNGKMLCEGDTIDSGFGKKPKGLLGLFGKNHFIVEDYDDDDGVCLIHKSIATFVSRPTDVPNEATKKKQELQEQIAKLEADKDKLAKDIASLRDKAKEM